MWPLIQSLAYEYDDKCRVRAMTATISNHTVYSYF
jgi:hypothetical protein